MKLANSALTVLITFVTFCFCADQDVITILKQQDGLASFTAYLEQYPDIVDRLNNGTFTVLAPHDDALAAFESNNTDFVKDQTKVEALIQYHISHQTHPSATFGLKPLFPATLLTNPNYTNVTGGQRVEFILENSKPTILSGVKAASHIVQPDIFFLGGLIHIIDSVLTIPVSFPATITDAGLDDLVALLNSGGWLNPSSPAAEIVNSLADLTIFGPNDPRFGASFTGFDGLSEQQLNGIFEYSIVQGTVIYSAMFKNNSRYKTLEGESVTFTAANGAFYVDASRITTSDYLCSNGVLQVVDMPLSPNTTGTRPAVSPEQSSPSGGGGLSSAAAAGLGIALGVLILGGGIVAALIIRTRKKSKGTVRLHDGGNGRAGDRAREGSMMLARRSRAPSDGHGVELEFHGAPPRYGAHELDNKALEEGTQVQTRVGTTVVELRTNPSPPGTGTGTENARETSDVAEGDPGVGARLSGWRVFSGRARSRAGGGSTATAASPTARSSVGNFSLRGPAGSGLPPSPNPPPPPPKGPQEIDGRERSRISIRIEGETPRHLGFQARY